MDFAQRAHDVSFGLIVHGEVGMIPVTQHTETDEVLLLAFDLFQRISAAQCAEFAGGNRLAVFFFHL